MLVDFVKCVFLVLLVATLVLSAYYQQWKNSHVLDKERFLDAVPTAAIRINCGSFQSYSDKTGRRFDSDRYFSGGRSSLGSFSSFFALNLLYRTQRFGFSNFTYEIPVNSTRASVTFYFAETDLLYWKGRRTFHVYIENQLVLENFDVGALAGGRLRPYSVTLNDLALSDGGMSIKFQPIKGAAMVSGIEVLAAPITEPTWSPSPPISSPTFVAPMWAPSPPIPLPSPVVMTPSAPSSNSTRPFKSVRWNAGGPRFVDLLGRVWTVDTRYVTGGSTYSVTADILDTEDDQLYQSYRDGAFSYALPGIPNGNYELAFHFAELYYNSSGARVFSIAVEDSVHFANVDVVALSEGKAKMALVLETVSSVTDGVLNINFLDIGRGRPFVSGIDIELLKPHLAHAIAQGPYFAVDVNRTGKANVPVDGSLSHTHGVGLSLTTFLWKLGSTTIGRGERAILSLPVGEHIVTLLVKDSGGNDSFDSTNVTVFPFGYPTIQYVDTNSSSIEGGIVITIYGSGFSTSSSTGSVKVFFGDILVQGTGNVQILDQSRLRVNVPPSPIAVPVYLSVETPLGRSNSVLFTYISGAPIAFQSVKMKNLELSLPTVLTFDSKKRLYVATSEGKIARLTLSEDFTSVQSSVISSILAGRTILGIAFDPMNAQDSQSIYVAHSTLFHGSPNSTSGVSINGKVSRIEGANMDVVVDVVTNLPVSDHDHAVNGLEFGDHGELYIQVGGNTNAGVPGRLSGSRLLKENPLSAATIVAYLSDPSFVGNLVYSADDDGVVVDGSGVQVFASGQRNSFDITLHSNGNLYATDNGPNIGYGRRSTDCSGLDANDPEEEDKLNLIVQGGYYGHPNRNRGSTDPKQCVWRSADEAASGSYVAPMLKLESSTNGIVEFQTDHFNKQLRTNLILSRYKDGLFRVILTDDGKRVIPQSDPALPLVGDNTLSVTQAPDGSLIDTRYLVSSIFVHKPIELPTTKVVVYGVFPRRGSQVGGYNLSIYGVNFLKGTPSVLVGAKNCIVQSVSATMIVCNIPGGQGTVDVVVKILTETSTFRRGFRYITGLPV